MEWPWPPHLLVESSFSKEIRKMLQSSITDLLSAENKNSSGFQLGQISCIQGKEISSVCIHIDWGLQSVILLHKGSFGWKCISMWLAKKKINFDGTWIFLVLSLEILPRKQKTSPADPTTSTLRHQCYNAKHQSVIYTRTGCHRHQPPRSHGMKVSATVPNMPQHLSNAKENKHIKL